jgi:uncharacterized membrane protein
MGTFNARYGQKRCNLEIIIGCKSKCTSFIYYWSLTMKKRNPAVTAAIGSLVAVGLTMAASTTTAVAAKADMEKCFGIVKAGKNDCQTANSSCAGTSSTDGQTDAWVLVPAGLCEKVVGGSKTTS